MDANGALGEEKTDANVAQVGLVGDDGWMSSGRWVFAGCGGVWGCGVGGGGQVMETSLGGSQQVMEAWLIDRRQAMESHLPH